MTGNNPVQPIQILRPPECREMAIRSEVWTEGMGEDAPQAGPLGRKAAKLRVGDSAHFRSTSRSLKEN